jgi:hypothetical protein
LHSPQNQSPGGISEAGDFTSSCFCGATNSGVVSEALTGLTGKLSGLRFIQLKQAFRFAGFSTLQGGQIQFPSAVTY